MNNTIDILESPAENTKHKSSESNEDKFSPRKRLLSQNYVISQESSGFIEICCDNFKEIE